MKTLPQSEIKAITKLLKNYDEQTIKLLEEQFKTFNTKTLKEINGEIPLDDIELQRNFLELALRIKRNQLKEDFCSIWDPPIVRFYAGDKIVAYYVYDWYTEPPTNRCFEILNDSLDWSKK